MDLKTAYAFGKTVDMSYAEAEWKVREELAKEGFGVLTEIDVKKIICREASEGIPRIYHPRCLQSASCL